MEIAEYKAGCNHTLSQPPRTRVKWFFLASFVVGILLCCFMASMITVALFTHISGEWWKVLLLLMPFLLLFAWATREMFRSFSKAGRRATRGRHALTR